MSKAFYNAVQRAQTNHESNNIPGVVKALKVAQTEFNRDPKSCRSDYQDELSDYNELIKKYKKHLNEDELRTLAGLTLTEAKGDLILKLAKKHFDVSTLETRGRDSLDFYSASVGTIKAALEEAYALGQADSRGK